MVVGLNPPAGGDAGLALCLHTGHHLPSAPRHGCWADKSTMNISSDSRRWFFLPKRGFLFMGLVLLATIASGCMSWRAESDQNWKQYNRDWKSPVPEDGRPQWGPFAAP
jgi:hypothetical protein